MTDEVPGDGPERDPILTAETLVERLRAATGRLGQDTPPRAVP